MSSNNDDDNNNNRDINNNDNNKDPPNEENEIKQTNNNNNNHNEDATAPERATTRANNIAHWTGRHPNGELIDCKNTAGPADDYGAAINDNNSNTTSNDKINVDSSSQPQQPLLFSEDEVYEPTDRDARNRPHQFVPLPRQQPEDFLVDDALPIVATVIATAVQECDAYPLLLEGTPVVATSTNNAGAAAVGPPRDRGQWKLWLVGFAACIAVAFVAVVVVGAVCGTGGCGSSRNNNNNPDSTVNSSPINPTAPSSSSSAAMEGATPTTTLAPTALDSPALSPLGIVTIAPPNAPGTSLPTSQPTGSRSTDIVSYINSVTLTGRIIVAPSEQGTKNSTNKSVDELVHEQALQWLIEDTNSSQLSPDNAANRFRLRQRYSLRTLFVKENSTDLWVNRTGWSTSDANECSWVGVICTLVDVGSDDDDASDNSTNTDRSLMQYAVTELNLYFNNVDGILATDLGLLLFLWRLNVEGNQLTGTIPSSLSQWSSLQSFQVHQNQLTGTIPSLLSQWSNLTVFDVGSNQLTGTIPSSLSQWSNMQEFDVYFNQLNGTIPSSLSQWSNLQECSMGSNLLTGTIPSSLSQWSNMLEFWVHGNQLNGTIPSSLSQWSNFKSFDVSYNQLKGTIPLSLSQWSNLQIFKVYSNQLTGTIPSSLSQWSNLTDFHVSYNQFTGTIPSSLSQWSNLKTFLAATNRLKGTITPLLSQWSNLSLFFVRGNQLNGTIPAVLGSEWSGLEEAYFDDNAFTGAVPSSFCSLVNLMILEADCLSEVTCEAGCCNCCY